MLHRTLAFRLTSLLAGLGALLAPLAATAQSATVPPLRVLVGFAPGGGTDVVSRIYADGLRDVLKTQVIVENKPGAGGAIAAQAAVAAPASQATLLFAIDHQVAILQHIMKNPGFDAEKDLVPLGRVVTYEVCLAVHNSVAARTVTDYAAAAKAEPMLANVAVPAPGSNAQFIAHAIGAHAGVKLTPVPYRGAAPAMNDLAGGQIKAAVMPCDAFIPFVKDGKVRILGIAGDKRSTRLPEVPALSEAGIKVPGTINFLGAYATRSMDPKLVAQLQAATKDIFALPGMVDRLNATGQFANYGSADEMARHGREASAFWATQVKASGYVAE